MTASYRHATSLLTKRQKFLKLSCGREKNVDRQTECCKISFAHNVVCLFCRERVSVTCEVKVVKCQSCGRFSLLTSLHQSKIWTFIASINDARLNLVATHNVVVKSLPEKKDLLIDQFNLLFLTNTICYVWDSLWNGYCRN